MKLLSSEDKKHPANRMPEGGKGKESKRREESPSLFCVLATFVTSQKERPSFSLGRGTFFSFFGKEFLTLCNIAQAKCRENALVKPGRRETDTDYFSSIVPHKKRPQSGLFLSSKVFHAYTVCIESFLLYNLQKPIHNQAALQGGSLCCI